MLKTPFYGPVGTLIAQFHKKVTLMKARMILICVLLGLCGNAFAQDIIHTIDGRSIEAKVLEINDDDILYKTFDNQDGPDYRMSVGRVTRIVFQNGTEKSFAPSTILVPSPYVHDPYGYYGPLEYRWGHYYDRRGRLYAEQLKDYLGVSLYGSDYRKARSQYQSGFILTISGAALVISSLTCGAMLSDYNRGVAAMNMPSSMRGKDHSSIGALYVAGGIAGAACLGAGIPLWIKGNRKLNAIADDYNQRYGRNAYGFQSSLRVGATGNGIGLALNF